MKGIRQTHVKEEEKKKSNVHNTAGAQKMLLGARNMQLGLEICGWVVKTGS
jgi:hypothetical protein